MGRHLHFIQRISFALIAGMISTSAWADDVPSPQVTKLVRVAIFDFDGSKSTGPDILSKFLTTSNGFQSTVVSSAEIRDGILQNYDVLICPGGSGSRQAKELKEEGRSSIRKFVRDGGGFVGICAGAYL